MKQKQNKIKWQIINSVLFFMILIMSGYYVGIVNDLAIKELKQHEYKVAIETKKEESRNLNNLISFYKSYEVLTEKTNNLKMTFVDNIAYLEPTDKLAVNYAK